MKQTPETVADTASQEKIPAFKAVISIALTLIVVIGIGFAVGYMFFWDKPQFTSKLEFDYQTAVANVKKYPKSTEFRVELGWIYAQKGEWSQALAEYDNALKIDKTNVTAKYNIALVKLQQNNIDDARTMLEQVIAERSTFTEARLTLGEVLTEQKDYDQALKQYEFVLNANPGTVDYILLIGQVYEKKGDLGKAREQYEKAIAYVPDLQTASEALKRLGGK